MQRGDPPERGAGGADPGSQERLVQAACELAREHFESAVGLRDAFSYLTPGAVARRAGLSRGLIYHYWGEQEADGSKAFECFLDAVSQRLWNDSVVADQIAEDAEELPDDLDEVVLAITAGELARYTGRDRALLRASQALTLHGASPEGAPEGLVTAVGEIYRAIGERVGLEPIPPLTHEDVAFAVLALFEGFGLFQNVMLDRTLRSVEWDGREWSLLAVATRGIVLGMSRPIATDDD